MNSGVSEMQQLKRFLIGRPLKSSEEGGQKLGKLKALAMLSSDALSSVAYVSTRTLYQPDFKQKRQIIPDTGSRPAGIICRSLYAH
jgi:hypothetical protein